MSAAPTILICAGAAKAGTSWLFRHLSAHPDCHLRSIKELHYFDSVEAGTFERQLRIQTARAAALAGRADRTAQWRDVAEWIEVLARRVEDLPAYLSYLTDGRGDRRLVADITPAYALLPEARLARIAGMAPDVRFVYLMREPVARLWSHARMLAARAVAGTEDFALGFARKARRIMDAILAGDDPGHALKRSDYAGAITRMRAAVAPSRLMVMFQDDMMTAPGLSRLSAFLGLSPMPGDFGRRIHAGHPLPISDDHRMRAAALLAPQYEFVAREFPALPDSWRKTLSEVSR